MVDKFIVFDEKDWETASPEQRDWMIFKTLKNVDNRLSELEHKSFIKNFWAFTGGIIGGVFAALGLKFGSGM